MRAGARRRAAGLWLRRVGRRVGSRRSGASARGRGAAPAVGSAEAPGPNKLAIGITEQNPNFVWAPPPRGPRAVRPLARRAGEDAARLRTGCSSTGRALQPEQGRPADLDAPNDGCLRDTPPCAGWARRARAARGARLAPEGGRLGGARGAHGLARVGGAAAVPSASAPARSRSTARRSARGAARVPASSSRRCSRRRSEEGAELRYWAPWNEPNHPFSLSPQRDALREERASRSRSSPTSRIAQAHARGARRGAGRAGLHARRAGRPGPREADHDHRSASSSAACPADLVCGTHGLDPARLRRRARGGAAARRCGPCAAKDCEREHAIWITETGVGAPRSGLERSDEPAPPSGAPAAGCTSSWSSGTRTRASPPPSSTRCARTTSSRPASSPPRSTTPTRRCASGSSGGSARASAPRTRRRRARLRRA